MLRLRLAFKSPGPQVFISNKDMIPCPKLKRAGNVLASSSQSRAVKRTGLPAAQGWTCGGLSGAAARLVRARLPGAEPLQLLQEHDPSTTPHTVESWQAPGHPEQEQHTQVIKCRHTRGNKSTCTSQDTSISAKKEQAGRCHSTPASPEGPRAAAKPSLW